MSLLNCQQFEHFQDHIPEPVSARPVPKLRPKSAAAAKAPIRPRPKTIHVDQGADVSASLQSSRGPRGSSSNLSGNLHGFKFALFCFFRFCFIYFLFVCLHFLPFLPSNHSGTLRRSESRNSVSRGATLPPTPTPAPSGLSLASMGNGRVASTSRIQPSNLSRPTSRSNSRRGSTAFLDEHSGNFCF